MSNGTSNIFDGINTNYPFIVYSINDRPSAANAVYIFCYIHDGKWILVYVGSAGDLSSRLSGHERMQDALDMGATHLLVYAPDPNYQDVERRLIARYDPDLNKHHTT